MNDKTKFREGLGWCLIWIGFGGCIYLSHHDDKEPIVRIENSFNRGTMPLRK